MSAEKLSELVARADASLKLANDELAALKKAIAETCEIASHPPIFKITTYDRQGNANHDDDNYLDRTFPTVAEALSNLPNYIGAVLDRDWDGVHELSLEEWEWNPHETRYQVAISRDDIVRISF